MLTLENAQRMQVYKIEQINLTGDLAKHLGNLGLTKSAKVALLSLNKENGIVIFAKSRLALDRKILQKIQIVDDEENEDDWLPLDELAVGRSGKVISIHGTGALKRRLMDMGITRNTVIAIRKVAPLGDPIEINIRGYELTLRKNEAQMVLMKELGE